MTPWCGFVASHVGARAPESRYIGITGRQCSGPADDALGSMNSPGERACALCFTQDVAPRRAQAEQAHVREHRGIFDITRGSSRERSAFRFSRGAGIIEFAATTCRDRPRWLSSRTIKAPTMPHSDREPIAMRPVRKVTPAGVEDVEDALAVEHWLRITLNGREVAALMCSPGHEEELGAGFALTQGLIRSRVDLLSSALRTDPELGDTVRIVIPVELSLSMAERVTARGVCGGDVRLDADLPVLDRDEPVVRADVLERMARGMTAGQKVYKRSGGTHAAGVFTVDGELVVVREDVGRHNALDKAVGHCLLSSCGLGDKVIVITGRASREIVTKAAWAGVPVLASVSAATAAGAEAADRARLTLVSFLRGRRMNICSHPQRIDVGGLS